MTAGLVIHVNEMWVQVLQENGRVGPSCPSYYVWLTRTLILISNDLLVFLRGSPAQLLSAPRLETASDLRFGYFYNTLSSREIVCKSCIMYADLLDKHRGI